MDEVSHCKSGTNARRELKHEWASSHYWQVLLTSVARCELLSWQLRSTWFDDLSSLYRSLFWLRRVRPLPAGENGERY